ncbi:hypothetical protein AB0K00_36280 [Dactylosporangium sp. NPDC049525]
MPQTVTIEADGARTSLRIAPDVDVLRGSLHLHVHPFIVIEESLLPT